MPDVTIGDLAARGVLRFGDGYRTKRSEHGQPGYRILRVADVDEGAVRLDGPDFVREDYAPTIGQKLSQAGDVLLTTKGTVGRVAIYPTQSEQAVYSPQLCYFRVTDHRVLHPRFLAYWFKSEAFTRQALHRANNTDMAPYINLRDIASLTIGLPDIDRQAAIAEILGALDDKIAASDKVIAMLSALEDLEARRLVASARHAARLDSVATVTKGVSYRSADLADSQTALVTLKSVSRNGMFSFGGFKPYIGEFKAAQLVKAEDIVVAQTDLTQQAEIVGRAVRVPRIRTFDRLVASLDLSVVRSASGMPQAYLLGALRQQSFREHCLARTSGTTVLHLGRGAVESYELPQPSTEAMVGYAQRAEVRFAMADSFAAENETLAKVRDELLPLLMSGKVRVRDAEKVVEGVA